MPAMSSRPHEGLRELLDLLGEGRREHQRHAALRGPTSREGVWQCRILVILGHDVAGAKRGLIPGTRD